jgi:antitoxin HicB
VAEVDRYLSLPYTKVVRMDAEGDFVARVMELPGCTSHGETEEEALANLREMQGLWIADAIEAGHPVPEPEAEEELPSGKWLQRVPRSLHRKVAELAHRDGVSLNQFVVGVLAEVVGARRASARGRNLQTETIYYNGCGALTQGANVIAGSTSDEPAFLVFTPKTIRLDATGANWFGGIGSQCMLTVGVEFPPHEAYGARGSHDRESARSAPVLAAGAHGKR